VAGRKPVGPALVARVSGSEQARARAEVLLETITGEKTMEGACRALGIEKTHLFQLRARMLEAAVASLEPLPIGRPPLPVDPSAARLAELEARVKQLELELEASRLRVDLAEALPGRCDEPSPRRKKKRGRAGAR
jgi:hypothetical protein